MATSFAGDQVQDARAIIIRRAIILWLEHGIRPNSRYTPTRMADAASTITGKPYSCRRVSLQKAADDIKAMYPKVCL